MTLSLPPGAWIEDKEGVCFALHYRDAPDARAPLLDDAVRIAAHSQGEYTVQEGRCVIELKPAGRDKGSATRCLMQVAPFLECTPIAVGDDLTDEHAFAECHARQGLGISVGDRAPTRADFRLDSPADVHAWLGEVTAALEARTMLRWPTSGRGS